MNKVIMSS